MLLGPSALAALKQSYCQLPCRCAKMPLDKRTLEQKCARRNGCWASVPLSEIVAGRHAFVLGCMASVCLGLECVGSKCPGPTCLGQSALAQSALPETALARSALVSERVCPRRFALRCLGSKRFGSQFLCPECFHSGRRALAQNEFARDALARVVLARSALP
jgi:hypothetical protein